MKILFLTQLYPPLVYGGGEYIFAKWAQEFARRGHEVCVITQKIVGTDSFEIVNGVKIHRVGPEIRYDGALYNIGSGKNLGFVVGALCKIAKLSTDFAILHSNVYMPSIVAQIAARRLRRPHIMTVHDVFTRHDSAFSREWARRNDLNRIVKWAGALVEKRVLGLEATRIHTVSETSKMDLIHAGIRSERISVIPNGIDPREYRSKGNKRPLQIAYVGRLVFYKNLETVIKAFRQVCDRIPMATFVIAGGGPSENDLKELVAQLQLQPNISFVGQITDSEKVVLLSQSQLTVQPSIMEGFGITIIESFCCGTPVLASDVMPLPEIVKSGVNGTTLSPFSIDAWANCICDYLNNPRKCITQGEEGRRLAFTRYTIDNVVDFLSSLYAETMAAYHRPHHSH